MKMMKKMFVCLGVIAMVSINLAMAENHTVGGANGGWDQSTDLATWAASQTFVEGDNLVFQYTLNHDVTEVSEADFASCSAGNPVQPPLTSGLAVVPLTSAGSRYFICGTGGHCLGGMKVQIDTIASSAPPPSTTPSLPTPPPSTTPSLPKPPPSTTPTVPAPPPAPSARPPPKSVAPTPSPKHSHATAPKISPPSKTATSNPALPPSSAPSPSGSLVPPQAPSSAVRFDVMGSLIACSGFCLMMFFNL